MEAHPAASHAGPDLQREAAESDDPLRGQATGARPVTEADSPRMAYERAGGNARAPRVVTRGPRREADSQPGAASSAPSYFRRGVYVPGWAVTRGYGARTEQTLPAAALPRHGGQPGDQVRGLGGAKGLAAQIIEHRPVARFLTEPAQLETKPFAPHRRAEVRHLAASVNRASCLSASYGTA